MRGAATRRGACILLTDDDLAVAAMLRDALEPKGHRIWHARTAAEALLLAEEVDPDVVLLELMLPDEHGLSLCADLRGRTGAPIIVCGATRRRDDVVIAFRLGAFDFVAKPFRLPELEARIEAAWRRAAQRRAAAPVPSARPERQRIGELVIDRATRRVLLAGRTVHLTPTEYRLLGVLAEQVGRAVAREQLVRGIWGRDDPTLAASLATHARRLRAKLRAGRTASPAFATLRGFGYRIGEEHPPRIADEGRVLRAAPTTRDNADA
jgi:DNA-binding response OmpR family regulator